MLNFSILGERKKRFIFRLDKMLLNYFFNRNLIQKIASKNGNFLFLTSRAEYYDTVRANADKCSQIALLWQPALLSKPDKRGEVFEKQYGACEAFHPGAGKSNVFVLFDNEKYRSERVIGEMDQHMGIPLISVLDTDSILRRSMFPIVGNDDSSISIYFYSFFVAHAIICGRKIGNLTHRAQKTLEG